MTQAQPPADFTMQRSSRDVDALTGRLEAWLATRLPPDAAPHPPGPTAKQNAPAFRPGRLEFPERTISRALR